MERFYIPRLLPKAYRDIKIVLRKAVFISSNQRSPLINIFYYPQKDLLLEQIKIAFKFY